MAVCGSVVKTKKCEWREMMTFVATRIFLPKWQNGKFRHPFHLIAATMCNRTTSADRKETLTLHKSLIHAIWPIHPLLIIAIAPFLPTWLYLSRGYTVWYHLITILYLLTQKEPLRRFLIIQGTGISLGWYSALLNDYFCHGRFGHILYMNMPSILKSQMVDDSGHVFYTTNSIGCMFFSHILDTILHPGIVYFLLRAHKASGKSWKDVVSWKVVSATFIVSRLWSLVHTYFHDGKFGGWYFGYDVYHIHDLDSWMPAYIAEGVLFFGLSLYLIARNQ